MRLAVGFFDGVHLGHRRILAEADAALTFGVHPLSVFAPARAPALVMSPEDRLAAIEAALAPRSSDSPACRVRALAFTAEFAARSPEDFLGFLRHEYPDLTAVRCGPNWTFGAGGAGDPAFLRARGLAVTEVPYVLYRDEPVSSTRIRAALAKGEMAEAAAMLGRAWSLAGRVTAGKRVGRALGYPTVNVVPELRETVLPYGVYLVSTALGRGLANWGRAPTMGSAAWERPVLEIHLETPPAEVPERLEVAFHRFLRAERVFASRAELAAQIAADLAAAGWTKDGET